MKYDRAIAIQRGYCLPEPTRLAHLHVNAVRTGLIRPPGADTFSHAWEKGREQSSLF